MQNFKKIELYNNRQFILYETARQMFLKKCIAIVWMNKR